MRLLKDSGSCHRYLEHPSELESLSGSYMGEFLFDESGLVTEDEPLAGYRLLGPAAFAGVVVILLAYLINWPLIKWNIYVRKLFYAVSTVSI